MYRMKVFEPCKYSQVYGLPVVPQVSKSKKITSKYCQIAQSLVLLRPFLCLWGSCFQLFQHALLTVFMVKLGTHCYCKLRCLKTSLRLICSARLT